MGNAITASVPAYGTVTAPGAAAAIATTGQLAPGWYRVTAYASYGATPDVADNMQVVGGATPVQLKVQPVANGTPVPIPCVVQLTAPGAISVQSIAGGAVGSVYQALLIVDTLSGASAVPA